MNAGVSLVQAYLHLNGYFTVPEFPVVAGRTGGRYEEVTDLDLLAVRLPLAAHRVARGRPGPEDDLVLATDPVLAPDANAVDVVLAEVKEGKPRLNDATRTMESLEAALARVGCVPPALMDRAARELRSGGEARVRPEEGPVAARVRLIAVGDGPSRREDEYEVIGLGHVARFVRSYLSRYHDVLHPADLSDPVLGLLHLLRKLGEDGPSR